MTKMTNAMALSYVLSNCEIPAEVSEKLEKMLAQVQKKNSSAPKKPTAKQVENEGFKAEIVEFLSNGGEHTVSEIIKGVPALNGLSQQKVSALMRQLFEAYAVNRVEVKGKAYFSLISETEEVEG